MTKFVGTPLRGTAFSTVADEAISTRVNGDVQARIRIDAGGKITWSSGAAAGDTNLYRADTNTLITDDVFKAISGVITLATSGSPTVSLDDGALAVDTTNNIFYFRSNGSWNQVTGGGGGATVTVSDTAPTSPSEGDLWFESDTGTLFIYYDSTWVDLSGGGGSDVSQYFDAKGDLLVGTGNSSFDNLQLGPNGTFLQANSSASAGVQWANIPTINYLDDVGDVSASSPSSGDFLKWNGSAWVNDVINLGTDTEGNYVSDLTGGTGVSITHTPGEGSSAQVAIGQDVDISASVTFAHVSADVTGDLAGNADTASTLQTARTISLTGDVSGSVSFDGSGDATITATIQPNSVALGTDTTGNYVSEISAYGGSGLTVSSPGESATIYLGTNATSLNSASTIVKRDENGNFEAGTITADLIGNASTATALDTARTIALAGDVSGSVSFDGTADATITAVIEPNSVALGTDTTGNYVAEISAYNGSGLTVSSPGESATIYLGTNATSNNSASTIVKRDENGNFDAGTITASLSGNASTASALQNARAITLTGDVSGSASFDGTGDAVITATIQPNSVALGTDTTGNYVNDITAGTGVTVTHTPGEGSSPTVAIGQAVGTSSSVAFAHVASDVTGNLTGNASTASTLQTARTIQLSGDVSGSATFNGASNVNIFTTVNTASVAIGELGGVVITNPEEFQGLAYDGTNWVNSYMPLVSYVRNVESTTLTGGTAVYLFGGTGDHASVKRADNTSEATSSKTVGLMGANVAASQNGPVITRGYVDGIDLSAYSVGDVLWLGTNGGITTTKPTPPAHLVFIGVVVRATNNGIVYVAVQNGYEINELHDVKTNGKVDKDVLMWNSASAVWVNDQINLGTDTVGNYVQNLVAGTGVTLTNNSGEGSTPTVAIGQPVATSSSVTFARVETTGNLVVGGNLSVSGSVITLNQESLTIDDPFIYLNNSGSVTNPDIGIAGNYNDGTYAHTGLFRDATDGKWKFFDSYTPEPSSPINVGHASYSPAPVVAETFESTVATGTAPFTVSSTTEVANLRAATATSLSTARNISLNGDLSGSASFNGGSDVTITATIQPNSVALGTDTTGNYMAGLTEGTGVTIVHTPGEASNATIAIGQPVATSSSVTFAAVSAPVIGNLTGNASTASALQTPRTISLTGDVSGSVSFDGSANASITATVQPNSVALGTDTTGNYVSDVTGGTGVTVTHTPGEGSSPTIAIGQAVGTSSSVQFAAVTAPLIGNASTATTLQNARTISLGGDLSGSASFNGSSDVTISATVQPNSVTLGADTTGNYVSDVTGGTGVTVTHTPGEGSSPTIAIGQAVGTSSSVQFAAVTAPLIGNVTGNASTASTLQTARTISLGGDLSGSASFNGSSDVTITATVQPNSVALGTDTTGNYMSGISAGTGISVTHTPGEGSSASVSLNATLDDLSNVTVPSPALNDVLKWNGTVWTSASASGGSSVRVSDTPPSSPAAGDLWFESDSARTYIYYDSSWIEVGALAPSAIVSDTAPSSPEAGQLWFNSLNGGTYIYYSSVWTEVGAVPVNALLNTINAKGDLLVGTADNTVNRLGVGTDGYFLKANSSASAGIEWASIPTINYLDDIGDVNVTSASAGQYLRWSGTTWTAATVTTDVMTDTKNAALIIMDIGV